MQATFDINHHKRVVMRTRDSGSICQSFRKSHLKLEAFFDVSAIEFRVNPRTQKYSLPAA